MVTEHGNTGHFCSMPSTKEKQTLPGSCWNLGEFVGFCNNIFLCNKLQRLRLINFPFPPRADPYANPPNEGTGPSPHCEDLVFNPPMEIAVGRENIEMLKILEEFAELTDELKLMELSILMYREDNPTKRFQNTLKSLPVDVVRISF